MNSEKTKIKSIERRGHCKGATRVYRLSGEKNESQFQPQPLLKWLHSRVDCFLRAGAMNQQQYHLHQYQIQMHL